MSMTHKWDTQADREYKLYRSFMEREDAEHAAWFRWMKRCAVRQDDDPGYGCCMAFAKIKGDLIGPDDVEEWHGTDGRPAHRRHR